MKIGKKAFKYCSIAKVYFYSDIKEIGDEAFYANAKHGGSFRIYTNIDAWCKIDFGKNVFKQTSVDLFLDWSSTMATRKISIPKGVKEIKQGAFCHFNIEKVMMPNSVTKIGNDAFYGCSGITSQNFKISPNVTEIGDSAFYGCKLLTSIPITDKMTEIKDATYMNCTGLTSVVIPNNITSIGNKAFWGCTGITSLTIPSSVKYIGEYILGNVDYIKKNKIEEIHCHSTDPASISLSIVSFNGVIGPLCKLYVPKGTKSLYENAEVWKKWKGYIEEEDVPYVYVYPSSVSVEVGKTKQIQASIRNSTTTNSLYYSSSDTSVVEISQKGVIIAKQRGTALITVKAANDIELGYCNVTVTNRQQILTWEQDFGNIYVGDEIDLAATASSGLAVNYTITQGSEYAEIKENKLVCKAAGEVILEARQTGNEEYEAAESISKTISIAKKQQTITWAQDFTDIHVGDEIDLTASASSGLSVNYTITKGSEYAEIKEDKLVCKAAGEVTIEARQTGNEEYEAAESISKTISIAKNQQSITWVQDFADIHVGDEVDLAASASSGLPMEYTIIQGSEYVEIADGKIVCKAAGDVIIEARQNGNEEYEAAESVSKTISISEAVTTFPLTIDGLTYNYCDGNDSELQVTRCTAEVAHVLAEVNGIPVTTLNQTFRGKGNVKAVYLPSSIVNLGFIPFEKNYNLTKITVDENNPALCDIDGVLFSKDKSTLLYYPAGKGASYTVPDGTTAMSDHAFSGDEQLTSIELPEVFVSIGTDAFQSCTGLTSFTFPSTIQKLDYGVIRECKNIMEIHSRILSPENVEMGTNVFQNIDKDKCTLYVPIGTKELYEATDQWKDFKNIVEKSAAGINKNYASDFSLYVSNLTIIIKNVPANSPIKVYTASGQCIYEGNETRLTMSSAGMYIVVVNGLAKKVLLSHSQRDCLSI